MHTLDVLLLGPDGVGRSQLAATVRGLGHDVTESADMTPDESRGDVLLVDMRQGGWSPDGRVARDERPAVLIAGEPRRSVASLGGRRSGVTLLSQGADPRALRVALNVCSGLSSHSSSSPPATVGS